MLQVCWLLTIVDLRSAFDQKRDGRYEKHSRYSFPPIWVHSYVTLIWKLMVTAMVPTKQRIFLPSACRVVSFSIQSLQIRACVPSKVSLASFQRKTRDTQRCLSHPLCLTHIWLSLRCFVSRLLCFRVPAQSGRPLLLEGVASVAIPNLPTLPPALLPPSSYSWSLTSTTIDLPQHTHMCVEIEQPRRSSSLQ